MEVLVVDDHVLFRDGLALLLRQKDADNQIHTCGTTAEAIRFTESHDDLDLILLDYNLPDGNGLDLLYQLKEVLPATPIALLSGVEDPALIQSALKAGASGFITKTSTSEVMLGAVALIMSGGVYVPPAILAGDQYAGPSVSNSGSTAQSQVSDTARQPAGTTPSNYQLTERQKDVLKEMVKGLSNKEIARELNMSPSTVKVHVAAILKALDVKNRTQVVSLAQQQGLCD